MFPGRFWVALGSGEASNEHITGQGWPRKELRDARLRECVDVIRALLAGEEVSHDGLVHVDRARLWTLPEVQPALICPAVSVATARTGAEWADGLVTVNQPHDKLREMIAAYRDAGGPRQARPAGAPLLGPRPGPGPGHRPRPVAQQRLPAAGLLGPRHGGGVRRGASAHVTPDDVAEVVLVSADLGQHAAWIAEYVELGFDEIYLHHVGQEQRGFLDAFGEHVLPQLDVDAPPAPAVSA